MHTVAPLVPRQAIPVVRYQGIILSFFPILVLIVRVACPQERNFLGRIVVHAHLSAIIEFESFGRGVYKTPFFWECKKLLVFGSHVLAVDVFGRGAS